MRFVYQTHKSSLLCQPFWLALNAHMSVDVVKWGTFNGPVCPQHLLPDPLRVDLGGSLLQPAMIDLATRPRSTPCLAGRVFLTVVGADVAVNFLMRPQLTLTFDVENASRASRTHCGIPSYKYPTKRWTVSECYCLRRAASSCAALPCLLMPLRCRSDMDRCGLGRSLVEP